jgi:hypothetical protein
MDLIEIPIAFGSAAAGALVGSWAAFRWNILQQQHDQKQKEHGALLRAQYALLSQRDTLEWIRENHLELHRKDENGRHLIMPIFHVPGSYFPVPLVDISFIASNNPNLLREVHVAQQGFETAIENLRQRNQRFETIFASSDVTIQEFNSETGAAKLFANEIGKAKIFYLKKATDNLYESISGAIPKLLVESNAVAAYIKQNFPGMKTLSMTPK